MGLGASVVGVAGLVVEVVWLVVSLGCVVWLGSIPGLELSDELLQLAASNAKATPVPIKLVRSLKNLECGLLEDICVFSPFGLKLAFDERGQLARFR